MKRFLFPAVLAVLFSLTACTGPSAAPQPPPASSRALFFNEIAQPPLYAVTVDRVLDHRYDTTGYDSLVLQTTVEEVFSAGANLPQGSPLLVWVGLDDLRPFTTMTEEEVDDAVAELRQIIEQADSLIVHGRSVEPTIVVGTPECDLWLSDTEGTDWDTLPFGQERCLDLRPSIRLPGLRGWQILPFRDGVLDGTPLEELIDSVGSEMAFDLDQEIPQGGQHFKNGDSTAAVYDAIREFAQ